MSTHTLVKQNEIPDVKAESGTALVTLQAEEIQTRPKNACRWLEKP